MKSFAVLLDLVTQPNVGIDFLGQAAALFTRLPSRKGTNEVVWRLESGLPDGESLERQVAALQKKIPLQKLENRKGMRAYLSIGVFYDTFTCSVQLSSSVIKVANDANIAVEITCYPATKDKVKKAR